MEPISRTKKNAVICFATTSELWRCNRCLNPRGDMLVYVYRGRRYRVDTWTQTTAFKLTKDNWFRIHRSSKET